MRLDRPIGTWLLLLPGWWAIALVDGTVSPTLYYTGVFGIGAVIMRGAGCVINDLWDRDLDSRVARTRGRPIASGAISVNRALLFLGALMGIGFLILMQMNRTTIALGLVSVLFIVAYPLAKRVTDWPQAVLGLTFNFGALMGWSAMTGDVPLPALLLYAGGFLWTIGYDTVYAHQDKEDDAIVGIRSTALKFGKDSRKALAGFYAGAWILMTMAFVVLEKTWLPVLFMAPAALHMVWQIKTWAPDDAASCLKIFRSNRDFGFLVLAAAAIL